MTTLLAGNSASFTLGTLQSLNISTGGTGSLSFTSSSEMAQPSFTASVANGDFGPYNVSMAVVMTMTSGSADYIVVGGADVTAEVNPLTGGIAGLAGQSSILKFDHNTGMLATLFNDASDWGTGGSSVTAPSLSLSSSYSKFSTNTLAINCGTGATGSNFVAVTNANPMSFETSGGLVGVWVYIPDYTKIDATNGILLYIATDSGFTNNILSTAYKPTFNGWHFIKLSRAVSVLSTGQKWNAPSGTATHSDVFQYIKFRFYPASGVTSTNIAYLDSMFTGSRQKKPSVILTFDDGYQSWADDSLFSAPYKSPVSRMRELGIKGTFFTIPEILGTGARGAVNNIATWEEINTIYADGNEIGVHGSTNLTTLADMATRTADVLANKTALAAAGFSSGNDVYAYPQGGFNISNDGGNEVHGILSSAGIVAAREAAAQKNYNSAECGADSYHHRTIGFDGAAGSETYTLMRQRIADAILAGGTCILLFHVFLDAGGTETSTLECKIETFYKLLDHIYALKSCGMIEVPMFSEWVHQYSPNLPAYTYR